MSTTSSPNVDGPFMLARVKEMYDLFMQRKSFFHFCTPNLTFTSGSGRYDDPGVHYHAGVFKGPEEISQGFVSAIVESTDFESYEVLNAGVDMMHPRVLMVWMTWTGKGKKPGGHHGTVHALHMWRFNEEGLVDNYVDLPDTVEMNYITNTNKRKEQV